MVCISRHEAEIKRQKVRGIIHLMPKIASAIEIMATISSLRTSIRKWTNKKKPQLRPEGSMSLHDDFELVEMIAEDD